MTTEELQATLTAILAGPKKQDEGKDYTEAIELARLDMTQENPDPEPIMKQDDRVFLSKGNFSAVMGQAKSRKTFLTTAIAGAYLSEDGHMGLNSPEISGPVLWIDTEMAAGHVARVARRICRIAKMPIKQNNANLIVLCLREYSPEERRNITNAAIMLYKPVICVIDGVADLIDTVNDEYASSNLIVSLMKVTKETDCHIMSVIHLNPGSTKPRGHLGSEILRKAETVLLVKKDGDGSKVIFDKCRDLEAQDFTFFVDGTGLPQLSAELKDDPKKEEALIKLFDKVMPANPTTIKYNDLVAAVCKLGKCKERTAKKKIADAINKEMIIKNALGAYYRPTVIVQQTIDMTPVDDDEMPF